ncbi:MAG: L-2-amino-thiazoline-4-carboxylic acid hydrolase, partial [Desulfobacterales bacterium]
RRLSKEEEMLAPEYRVGFRVLREKIGLLATLSIAIPTFFNALMVKHKVEEGSDKAEGNKADLKNHFQLLANMYKMLERRYGKARTDEIMRDVLLEGGNVFFRGFRRLGTGEKLGEFVGIYKAFERNNIVFDVIEESDKRFEIEIKRCLVFEAFNELGVPALTQWMCDIAFHYFSRYHPQMTYEKDRMIARGAASCHEVFTWS